jgi:short subunit dehydrogenase-like uncharacterized protein
MMNRELDIILWGATGFTGKLVAEYFANHYGCNGSKLKWAIAGRNEDKLKLLRSSLTKFDPSAENLPIITADIDSLPSLQKLTRRTQVVCTTVGPYNLYGKILLKACLEEQTNYCDLTGEPNFIRYSIDTFHKEAKDKKIQIVHSCGFDSIPSDLGTLLLQKESERRLGSLCKEVLFVAGESKGSFSGGTIASLLGVIEEVSTNENVRKILEDPYSLNPPEIRGEDTIDPTDIVYIDALQTWACPFVMGPINTRVVRRSSALLHGSNPYLYQERMGLGDGIGGWLLAQSIRFGLGSILVLGTIGITRNILKSTIFPLSGEGPDPELRESGFFNISILGFKNGISNKADIQVNITGKRDPGYGATSRMIGESAVALAKGEVQPIYGVITPAIALGLPFLEKLKKVDIEFQIVNNKSETGTVSNLGNTPS